MLPFYVVATVLVVGALVVGSLWSHPGRPLDVRTVQATGTPSASRVQSRATIVPSAVRGNAPWALSALPECFRQELAARGPLRFVRSRLPAGARAIAAGTVLNQADCVVTFGVRTIGVMRGDVRLVVPPDTRAFVAGGSLAVLRRAGANAELRVYRAGDGGPLRL